MKIGVLGGGSVGQTLAAKLIKTGHDVRLGIRNPSVEELAKDRNMAQPLSDWQTQTKGKIVTFAGAAAHAEMVFNATKGEIALDALAMAGASNLDGKVLVDVSNPLDFSQGMPPALLPQYDHFTSLGEEIQKAFPQTRVVKAFNTIGAPVMVEPSLVPGDHDLLIAGNDETAKALVADLARKDFGWQSIVDLGDIAGARASEHLLPLWVRLWSVTGSAAINIKIAKGDGS